MNLPEQNLMGSRGGGQFAAAEGFQALQLLDFGHAALHVYSTARKFNLVSLLKILRYGKCSQNRKMVLQN